MLNISSYGIQWTISTELSKAATFATWSDRSFPTIHTWALNNDISMLKSALSRLVNKFLIISAKRSHFLQSLNESKLFLLSVKMLAVYTYVCKCIYECMYVCIYMYEYIYVFMYLCTYVRLKVCMCVCIDVCTVYVCTDARMKVCTYKYVVYIFIYVWVYICI